MLDRRLFPFEQAPVCYLGTLRTDFGLSGVDLFLDFVGADFIGAGVSVSFLAGGESFFCERLLAVFWDEDELLALLLERLGVFFAVERGERFDLAGGGVVGVSEVDNAARAR